MSNETVTIEGVEVDCTTDVEVRLSRIVAQVDLSDMLDEYDDHTATLEWVGDNCSIADVLNALMDHHESSDVKDEIRSLLPTESREPLHATREIVGNGMGWKWSLDGKVRAVGVMSGNGAVKLNTLDNGNALRTFHSETIMDADALVDWMISMAVQS